MSKHQCENCKLRAKHDQSPKSLMGKFWRWHINFCPGWKAYYNSLNDQDRQDIAQKYSFKR